MLKKEHKREANLS